MAFFLLVFGLGIIFLAAEIFTNAVEWLGKHLNLNEGSVGSILAAVGTALPETTVAIVAVITGAALSKSDQAAHTEAGIGAILGAPMMLSTLAMFITGAAVLIFAKAGKRSTEISANYAVVGRDLRSFFIVYMLAFGAAFIPGKIGKLVIAVFLLGLYAHYVHRTLKGTESNSEEDTLRPLHFHRQAEYPKLKYVIVQLIAGLALMIFGAGVFVDNVTKVAESIGISAFVISVMITPIATELPEKFNSITWIGHKKDTLALGNITGAMVFQSSVLPAIGMIFTPWVLNQEALFAIVISILATFIAWADMTFRKRLSPYSLLLGGTLYLLYPISVFFIIPSL